MKNEIQSQNLGTLLFYHLMIPFPIDMVDPSKYLEFYMIWYLSSENLGNHQDILKKNRTEKTSISSDLIYKCMLYLSKTI